LPDAVKGARIVAVVTKPIHEQLILQELSKRLPPIALPKRFVVLEDLPKMPSGKTDFKEITKLEQDSMKRS
jgi:acyl-[acyl-carrier-protein]-phospholipid O-acyltransferase/long-chain-fatty-acid--[acyl-carrier-protein] ligase